VSAVSHRLRELHRDDRGTSLAELVVGMMVMGIFMTIFTGAVVSMAKTVTKVEAVTTSTAQVNNAFLQLDRRVRYADAISTIGPATGTSGDSYVELGSVPSAASVQRCTQLRVDVGSQKLQLRTWTATGSTTYSDLTGWTPLASFIVPLDASGASYQPFSTPPVSGAPTSFQRLTITLVAGTSGASSPSTTKTSFTYTAFNSSVADATNATVCQQGLLGGLRP
jgi:hypothetical protein